MDPHISYSKLREDAGRDHELIDLIDSARSSLEKHFAAIFPYDPSADTVNSRNVVVTQSTDMTFTNGRSSPLRSSTFSFMAGYESEGDTDPIDELNEYFNMKRERSWKDGEPI